jgi:hypothetical protein
MAPAKVAGSYAERQRKHRDECEAGVQPKLPCAIAQVLQEIAEPRHAIHTE